MTQTKVVALGLRKQQQLKTSLGLTAVYPL